MDAVVVLPCVPATARHRRVAQMAASTSERGGHPDATRTRLGQLGVVRRHRRGVGHGVRADHLFGPVPDRDGNAVGTQALGHR